MTYNKFFYFVCNMRIVVLLLLITNVLQFGRVTCNWKIFLTLVNQLRAMVGKYLSGYSKNAFPSNHVDIVSL
jgi:hypothetical protein